MDKNPPASAGTQVLSRSQEDPACHEATKPCTTVSPSATTTAAHAQSLCHNKGATTVRSPGTTRKNRPCSLQLEKARTQQQETQSSTNEINKVTTKT